MRTWWIVANLGTKEGTVSFSIIECLLDVSFWQAQVLIHYFHDLLGHFLQLSTRRERNHAWILKEQCMEIASAYTYLNPGVLDGHSLLSKRVMTSSQSTFSSFSPFFFPANLKYSEQTFFTLSRSSSGIPWFISCDES
ncbi:hypothetical protein SADUNF_Sadunf05G0132400 [Salix dunnii]|uniref:Uncharacterized protein n=1 Tax=Salix dunnii TaxID=1413687 RepID=A0A835K3Z1_9ROSI|nr:hypothetical protein SADUNF_Sadunf05G0132400 [Salix dunnii]